jgi:hypothetical protein
MFGRSRPKALPDPVLILVVSAVLATDDALKTTLDSSPVPSYETCPKLAIP